MSENSKNGIVIVGAAHMDLQVFPVNRTLLDVASFPAQKMVWSVGGDAINEATIITRMGHPVKLISCFGDDMIGSMILEHCEKNGIDTSHIKLDKDKITGINIGLIGEDGERTFINNRSGSIWTFEPEDVDLDAVKDAKILCFASIFNNPQLDERLMIPLFEKAKSQGMIICADIVGAKKGETLEDIRKALSYVDYFFPNYDEAKEITGQDDPEAIADVLLSLGVKNVLLKIGKKGCLVKNAEESFVVPGYPHSNCIDTTGAGDNFAAGFISGLLEGKSLKECAQMANCVASIAVEEVGATDGVKNRAQVEKRFEAYLKAVQE
ncbi:MAG: sugar kinase [Lachnospiraceae bacterium]|nr:sugar kinase [Lachnospiraceae bacterium]